MKKSITSEIVTTCVPRRDGSYLIVTNRKRSAISPKPLNEGMPIKIEDGTPYGRIVND